MSMSSSKRHTKYYHRMKFEVFNLSTSIERTVGEISNTCTSHEMYEEKVI